MTISPNEKAHDYREGFLEGVRATIKVIGDDLPEEQMRVLEKWLAGPLSDWANATADRERPQLPMLDGA